MAQNPMFRKVALERLSSPEQLDLMIRVTSPAGWYALLVLGALLSVALIWGCFGSIPTKVRGQGILIREGGVSTVVATGTGQVDEVAVQVGDYVRNGQVVTRLYDPLKLTELRNARADLQEAKSQYEQLREFTSKDAGFQAQSQEAQKKSISASIKALDEQVQFARRQLARQEELLVKGLIIPARVEGTRQSLNAALEGIAAQKIKQQDIVTQQYALKNRHRQTLEETGNRIATLERRIAMMEKAQLYDARVVSKLTGRVLEVLVLPGQMVSMGQPVVRVGSRESKLEALLFVPATEGKKIEQGMAIDINPGTVKREEHGSVLGIVTFVASYPASYEGMASLLGNEQLARTLSAAGAPMVVRADLIPDTDTPSGYKWSSGKGPAAPLHGGVICTGEVVVKTARPISLVIPFIKETLGV